MHPRLKVIAEIETVTKAMGPLVIEAGIKVEYITLPTEQDNIPNEMLRIGWEWLQPIYLGPWAACKEIKDLLAPEQWQQYALLGMDGSLEVEELRTHLRTLRKAIINKTRPRVFRKNALDGIKKLC